MDYVYYTTEHLLPNKTCVTINRPCLREDYSVAGNFRGVQISRFSRLIGKPQKLNPQNKVLTCD